MTARNFREDTNGLDRNVLVWRRNRLYKVFTEWIVGHVKDDLNKMQILSSKCIPVSTSINEGSLVGYLKTDNEELV